MYPETQRMIIRNFTTEDSKDLYEILGDDKTMEYCFEKTANPNQLLYI